VSFFSIFYPIPPFCWRWLMTDVLQGSSFSRVRGSRCNDGNCRTFSGTESALSLWWTRCLDLFLVAVCTSCGLTFLSALCCPIYRRTFTFVDTTSDVSHRLTQGRK
jgi:hypothetical protein